MRKGFPDYKTPVLAFFRAPGIWVAVMIIGGVTLVLSRSPMWAVNAFFVVALLSGVGIALRWVIALAREEERAKAATATRGATTTLLVAANVVLPVIEIPVSGRLVIFDS